MGKHSRAAMMGITLLAAGLMTACGGMEPEGSTQASQAEMKERGPNLLQLALQLNDDGPFAGSFDTLISAVLAADPAVAELLSKRGQLTVFAPTDAAFAAIGLDPDSVAALDQGFLTSVLQYHVARGYRDAQSVTSSKQIRMIAGGFVYPYMSATLTDNLGRKANIVVTDVPASNGIIHAIDAVLLPQAP